MDTRTIIMEPSMAANPMENIARAIKKAVANCCQVKMHLNSIHITVNADSVESLIWRDAVRAMNGYIGREVGPYPKPELSDEEKQSDIAIEEEAQKRREEHLAQDLKEAAEHRKALDLKMSKYPQMNRDDGVWQKALESIEKDENHGYHLGCYRFAEYWARLMQAKMSEGKELRDIINPTSYEAAEACGISGGVFCDAVEILRDHWEHGEELFDLFYQKIEG